MTAGLPWSRSPTQRQSLDSRLRLQSRRQLSQTFTSKLARGANRRGNMFRRSAWNQLNQLAPGAHASRRLQLERLSIPSPRDDAPDPVSLFSPAREHKSVMNDRNVDFVSS
jgi:hypothetical protein